MGDRRIRIEKSQIAEGKWERRNRKTSGYSSRNTRDEFDESHKMTNFAL